MNFQNVFKCDFLNLTIDNNKPIFDESRFEEFYSRLTSPITVIPGSTFHVVVFSLLLEYFPSRDQRWRCCEKAHELLTVNGLLLIITPDSHHQNKNAPMMKSWKRALEIIGFERHRYEKQEHLHCTAYRKVLKSHSASVSGRDPDLLFIPQDFSSDVKRQVTSQAEREDLTSQNSEYDCSLMDFGELSDVSDS